MVGLTLHNSRIKISQRRCIVCRISYERDKMLRLVCDENDNIWPDVLSKASGRGSWLCMRSMCLSTLRDKHFAASWRKPIKGQYEQFLQRAQKILAQRCSQLLGQHRCHLSIGREAILIDVRQWQQASIFLAQDAGAALCRDITHLYERYNDQKQNSIVIHYFPSATEMGAALGRARVSVVALRKQHMAEKLAKHSVWYKTLQELGA
ncbi:MAG: DUF448 domain-containing protein [Mariprofundales bacterium]